MQTTPRPLEAHEQEACLDLWDAGFTDTPRDFFVKYFQHDANYQHGDTIVVEVDGQLVSAVHVVRREAYTREGIIGVGGIANVATHPDFRGKGYNAACLNAMIAHLDVDSFFDMSLLGTGIHDYYAKFGWERRVFYAWKGKPKPIKASAKPIGLVKPIVSDLLMLQNLYKIYNQSRPLTFCRTPSDSYWSNWMQWDRHHVYMNSDNTAYALINRQEGKESKKSKEKTWRICEIGGIDSHTVADFLTTLVAEAHVACVTNLILAMPISKEINAQLATLLDNPTPEPIPWWMVRAHKNTPLLDLTNGYFYEADGF
jgi:predicted acetyltransferase